LSAAGYHTPPIFADYVFYLPASAIITPSRRYFASRSFLPMLMLFTYAMIRWRERGAALRVDAALVLLLSIEDGCHIRHYVC